MKKFTWIITLAIVLLGCTDPMDVRLPIENGELIDSPDFKEVVQKLTKADQEMLLAYTIRAAMVAGFTKTPMTSVTIGEAIESQKKFLAEEKAKADKEAAEAAKQAAEEKAARDAHEAKLKAFRDRVRGVLLEKWYRPADYRNGIVQDALFFKVAFTNKTNKKIVGMKGSLELHNTLGDRISGLNITIEDDIPPGENYVWSGGFNFNQFAEDHVALRDSDTAKIVSTWQPEVIMYEDGTVERME